jgi:3-deoxy-manno-octulosonate cytidylyltransferase (CMP-KDO synthetase)
VVIGAIPARYGSSRLSGKPLRSLAGRPLIEHVYRRASEATRLDRVVVLTDDDRISEEVVSFGGLAELTPVDCASGTDRIAWAARDWPSDAAVINIQGDEPLIDPTAIDRIATHLRQEPGDPLVTLATQAGEDDIQNPDVVKVVLDRRGYALYFSRSPIPYPRSAAAATTWRHVGIYGYQMSALLRLAELEPTPLERSESLEQLRALEHGIAIRVMIVDHAWAGVDTMEDLHRVESLLRRGGSATSD